jgi:hypothetical protein
MSSEGQIPTLPRYDVQKAYPVPFRAATWSEDVNGNFVIVLKEHSIRKRGQPRPEAPGTNFVRIPLGPVATSNDPEKYSCVVVIIDDLFVVWLLLVLVKLDAIIFCHNVQRFCFVINVGLLY